MHGRFIATTVLAATLVAVPAAHGGAGEAQTNPRLVAVRAAAHPGFDRVVFEFRGGLPARRQVRYVSRLVQDGSGALIPMPGRAILEVVVSNADAHNQAGSPTAPRRLTLPLKNVMRIERAGDFEAVVTYGIGVAIRRPFTVRTLRSPDRLVVDVDTRFRAVTRRVYFLNQPRFNIGREPYTTAVSRQVPSAFPSTGVLDRLYAGPTAAETSRGLRLVTSRSTGFGNHSVTGGVARVRLRGGCSSGGSTFTVAGLISPSLLQFASIDAVRIEDPRGRTQTPAGDGSSIPVCLEP